MARRTTPWPSSASIIPRCASTSLPRTTASQRATTRPSPSWTTRRSSCSIATSSSAEAGSMSPSASSTPTPRSLPSSRLSVHSVIRRASSTLVLLVASSTHWAIPSAVAVSSAHSRRTTGSTRPPRISSGHRAPASSSAVTSISRSAGWIRSSSPIRRRSTYAGDSMPVGIASPSPPPRSSTTSVAPASRQRAQGRSSSTSGTTS